MSGIIDDYNALMNKSKLLFSSVMCIMFVVAVVLLFK